MGPRRVVTALVVVVVAMVLLTGCGRGSACGTDCSTGPTSTQSLSAADRALVPASRTTDLPTVLLADLPPEALTTLRLIAKGGPFPYSQDGAVFSNRERMLPSHPNGWYHEYTVVTPGSSNRGARRIISGKDGALFWTDDHYASFHEILNGESP